MRDTLIELLGDKDAAHTAIGGYPGVLSIAPQRLRKIFDTLVLMTGTAHAKHVVSSSPKILSGRIRSFVETVGDKRWWRISGPELTIRQVHEGMNTVTALLGGNGIDIVRSCSCYAGGAFLPLNSLSV